MTFEESKKSIENKKIFIEKHIPLVYYCIKRFGITKNPDLIQEGIMAIEKAWSRYEEGKSSFKNYAMFRIRQSFYKSIASDQNIPVHTASIISTIKKVEQEYFQKKGELPSEDYILKQTKIKKETLCAIKKRSSGIQNNKMTDGDGETIDLIEKEQDNNILNPHDELQKKIKNEKILEIISSCLSEKEGKIICMRFGINCPIYTLKQIGEIYSLSHERVRQIEENAIRKIKNNSLFQYIFG